MSCRVLPKSYGKSFSHYGSGARRRRLAKSRWKFCYINSFLLSGWCCYIPIGNRKGLNLYISFRLEYQNDYLAKVCIKSLPCVKGGGTAKAVTEGLRGNILRIRIGFRQIRTATCINPSVKNQIFLTAPFTQGSLWALPRPCNKRSFIFVYSLADKKTLPKPTGSMFAKL